MGSPASPRSEQGDGCGAAPARRKSGALIKDVPLDDTVGGGPNFGLAVDARLRHLIVLTDNQVTTYDATRL